jgi:hypothetical protein
MPLTDWAKRDVPKKQINGSTESDLRDLIDGLDLPTEVAAVTYGGGCRIRRVRVPAPRTPAARGARVARSSRPVILSKRALDEVRTDTQSER